MIDLNLNIYKPKDSISRDIILSAYSSLDIFRFYINKDLVPYKLIKSPLRNDLNASFAIFKHFNGQYFFKDFGGKTGDCFHFVSILFDYNNYSKAISRVGIDFGFSDEYYCNIDYVQNENYNPNKYEDNFKKHESNIKVKLKEWNQELYDYWNQFNISKKTLEYYNVYPISHFFVNDFVFKAEKIAFVYYEFKDNKTTKKIYQPYSKKIKFLAEHDYSVIDGFMQIPDNGDLLIITKSRKDIMCIHDLINIPVIGTQGETVLIKENVMNDLKQRFKHQITLFDNDNAGIKLMNDYKSKYNIDGFVYQNLDIKDTSELVFKYGKNEAKTILEREIKKCCNYT